MKIITYSRIGYNHPSQANWNYGIWKVDLIDTNKEYCLSETVLDQFGSDSRFKNLLKEAKVKVIETKGIYTSTGTQKITGIRGLDLMDSPEFINGVIDWYKAK